MIAGWGPIPALGVYGAALATVLTRGLGFVVGLGLLWRRGGLRLDPNPAVARTIARIGLPTMLTGVLFSGIYMLLVRVVGRFGTPAIAALGVGHKIEGVTYMICIGFGLAAETIVGQNLGAGQPARAREAGWMTARIASIAPWAFGILFLLVPDTLVGVFTGDAAVIRDAALYLRAAGVAQLVIAYENVLEGGLTGAGYTLYTMVAVVGISALRVPLAEVVAEGFGLVGVWWMLALTAMARAGAMAALWQWGDWERARA
jgi:putative MATE family efflux protein